MREREFTLGPLAAKLRCDLSIEMPFSLRDTEKVRAVFQLARRQCVWESYVCFISSRTKNGHC